MTAIDLIVQTPADSIAGVIGGAAGAFVTAKLAAGIGIVTKFATDLFLKIRGMHDKLPSVVKPFVALAISTGLVFLNGITFKFGGPEVSSELMLPSLIAWGVGMGFHSLVNAVKKN